MVNLTALAKPMSRLLAAVLLCFAIVVSQFAHADVPSVYHEPASASAVDADAEHAHAALGDEEPGSQHPHEKVVDGKCASHCPSIFFPSSGDFVADLLTKDAKAPMLASALSDNVVAGPERPPRT